MNQNRNLPPSGHAVADIREDLLAALEAARLSSSERRWFMHLSGGHSEAVRLIGKLWNCTDTIPSTVCELYPIQRGSSYAQLVRELKRDVPPN
jgi:hypothetical protein